MHSECIRIATQLRNAFAGDPWHGDAISKLLEGITQTQALSRHIESAHSIWEIVLHIDLYIRLAAEPTRGVAMPKLYGTEGDWPSPRAGDGTWLEAANHLKHNAEQRAQAIEEFGDARLHDVVPGRSYDFYYLFHGLVQHSLYHAGQIALLKRSLPRFGQ